MFTEQNLVFRVVSQQWKRRADAFTVIFGLKLFTHIEHCSYLFWHNKFMVRSIAHLREGLLTVRTNDALARIHGRFSAVLAFVSSVFNRMH